MKFQDAEFLTQRDMAHAVASMRQLGRFQRLLFVVDTCKAASLTDEMATIPGVVTMASSDTASNSLSHVEHNHEFIGNALVDEFTFEFSDALRRRRSSSPSRRRGAGSLKDLFDDAKRGGKIQSFPVIGGAARLQSLPFEVFFSDGGI